MTEFRALLTLKEEYCVRHKQSGDDEKLRRLGYKVQAIQSGWSSSWGEIKKGTCGSLETPAKLAKTCDPKRRIIGNACRADGTGNRGDSRVHNVNICLIICRTSARQGKGMMWALKLTPKMRKSCRLMCSQKRTRGIHWEGMCATDAAIPGEVQVKSLQ